MTQVNAMQNKDQQKKYILKTILTYFSCKKKAITRYTRIYITLNIKDNTQKTREKLFSLRSLNKNSGNVVLSGE